MAAKTPIPGVGILELLLVIRVDPGVLKVQDPRRSRGAGARMFVAGGANLAHLDATRETGAGWISRDLELP